jgi:uncharacterized protein (TIGR03435 family)
MSESDDHDLLAQYAQGPRENSEAAFAALAERHVNLVYSTALRSVGNAHAAQEIAQAVFIILANKAGKLSHRVVLSGWLYQTTRLTAANFLRGEFRRQKREQEAFMQSTLQEPADDPAWRQIAPLLDDALGKLGERDRNAIVLRFFEDKNLHEVGLALGASEDAAKMRVNRALEKLRKIFGKRDVKFSAAAIAAVVSANSVHAAPVGLAMTVAMAAAQGAAISGSTLTLITGALKIMAWSKTKTAVAAGVVVLFAAGMTTVSVKKYEARQVALNSWRLPNLYFHPEALSNALPQVRILPTKFMPPVYGGTYVPPGKLAMVRAPVVDIVSIAYGCSRGRIIFSEGEPRERYDFVATLPHGNGKALQQEIKKTLGLVAHKETRAMDVLALKVRDPNNSGVKPYDDQGTPKAFYDIRGHIICTGQSLATLADRMEIFLRVPVIDETGLTANYNLDLKWNEDSQQNSNHDLLKQALTDQLGLELVPTNMPIEMLVVEKVNN